MVHDVGHSADFSDLPLGLFDFDALALRTPLAWIV